MNKLFLCLVFSVGMFVIFPADLFASVLINEFSSYETNGDWIELYSDEDTDISNWIIRDEKTTVVYTIPPGSTIGPSTSKYFTFEVGERLNRSEDTIKLMKSDDSTVVDQIPYGKDSSVCSPESGQSVGRYPDANSTIERFSTPTKGVSNNSATLDPCPTPTEKPQPTATPTHTPQPTNTPVPTSTPKPTSTIKPTPKPTKKPTSTPEPEVIALNMDETPPSEILDSSGGSGGNVLGESSHQGVDLIPIMLISSGVGVMGLSGFFYYAHKKNISLQDLGITFLKRRLH